MANGRNKLRRGDAGRDAGGFVALPWSVLDSPAFAALSHPARSLILELARQFVRDNNGRLLASGAYLAARGWRSNDVITRAVRELVAAGFVHQTAQGHRPNKASWYAVTWRALDRHPGYDVGATEGFRRGAYRLRAPAPGPAQITLPTPSPGAEKNASLTPSPGVGKASRAPSPGVGGVATAPSPGAVEGGFDGFSTPSPGDHLESHLPASAAEGVQDVEGVQVLVVQASPGIFGMSEAAPRPTGPRRRQKHHGLNNVEVTSTLTQKAMRGPAPQPPDPTAQLELLLPMGNALN